MGFLRRILGGGVEAVTEEDAPDSGSGALLVAGEAAFELHADRHRVTVWLRLHDPSFEDAREQLRVFGLEDEVMRRLERSGAGEHDTNSLERGYVALRLVGEDADAIVSVVAPLLRDAPDGSYLAVRRGPSGSPEDRLDLPIEA